MGQLSDNLLSLSDLPIFRSDDEPRTGRRAATTVAVVTDALEPHSPRGAPTGIFSINTSVAVLSISVTCWMIRLLKGLYLVNLETATSPVIRFSSPPHY